MQNNLAVTSSPHIFSKTNTRKIMLDVCLALLPALVMSIYYYGVKAATLIAVSVCTAVVCEFVMCKVFKMKNSISDLSAVVTGLLLAFNLPANAPWWIAFIGAFLAIVLVKMLFGGLGCNFMNPALTARAILFISWGTIMGSYPVAGAVDTISTATPLAVLQNTGVSGINMMDLFLGNNIGGVLGETCKIALILGGLYLLLRGVITWHIPVCFIATVFVCYFAQTGDAAFALAEVLSGGLLLGAIFMATDYVTAPVTGLGKIIYAVGCGVFLFVIRAFCSFVEGCSFAILFMNVCTPLIDQLTGTKPFGEVKSHG